MLQIHFWFALVIIIIFWFFLSGKEILKNAPLKKFTIYSL